MPMSFIMCKNVEHSNNNNNNNSYNNDNNSNDDDDNSIIVIIIIIIIIDTKSIVIDVLKMIAFIYIDTTQTRELLQKNNKVQYP